MNDLFRDFVTFDNIAHSKIDLTSYYLARY